MTARGLRNFNPCNIRKGDRWQGMAAEQPDPDFVTFATVPYGYRAAAKVFSNYQTLYGLWSIRAMISRWAPPSENDTGAYVADVASACGVSPDETFAIRHDDNALKLLRAVTIHENGSCPYPDSVIQKGLDMAWGSA